MKSSFEIANSKATSSVPEMVYGVGLVQAVTVGENSEEDQVVVLAGYPVFLSWYDAAKYLRDKFGLWQQTTPLKIVEMKVQ